MIPHKMITFIRILFVISIASTFFQCSSPGDIIDRPNVLLVLVDDMGYGDVSNSGNPYVNTPVLDEMARTGINFKYFYVSPVCAPTRASLLTGRWHTEVGVRSVTNGYEILDPEAFTLAELLKEAGYRTAIYGKWHLGEYYPSVPNAQGFDDFIGFRTGHTDNYFDPVLEHNGVSIQTKGCAHALRCEPSPARVVGLPRSGFRRGFDLRGRRSSAT